MAIGWTLSYLKIALILSAVLSTAVIVNLSAPIVGDFVTAEVPVLWSAFLSWLRPPYVYLVLNCIILTIVVSSKLLPSKSAGDSQHPPPLVVTETDGPPLPPPVGFDGGVIGSAPNGGGGEEEEEFVIRRSEWMMLSEKGDLDQTEEVSSEKPLASSRFGGHRRSVRSSPDGRATPALGVTKPRRGETLEATWRTITEGRQMPLTRHLKKSETWETGQRRQNHAAANHDLSFSSPVQVMKKSDTFGDRTSVAGGDSDSSSSSVLLSPSPRSSGGGGTGSGRLRRESSLSQDELNRRVEAFIRKFNEDMRLQRRQSLEHYREMMMISSPTTTKAY